MLIALPPRPTAVRWGVVAIAALAACGDVRPAVAPVEPQARPAPSTIAGRGPLPDVIAIGLEAAVGLACGVEPGFAAARLPVGPRFAVSTYTGGTFGALGTSTEGFPLVDLQNGVANGQVFTTDINDAGQVVGSQSLGGLSTGFVWTKRSGNVLVPAPAPYTQSFAQGNDNQGRVVGYYQQTAAIQAAFLWQNGSTTMLPQAFDGGTATTANAINDAGRIVGAGVPAGGSSSAVMYTIGSGPWTDLGRPNGFSTATARAISSNGIVAGSGSNARSVEQPWVWSNGVFTALSLGDATSGRALGVNASGDVVGFVTTASGVRGAYWRAGSGTPTIVGPLPNSGLGTTRLTAINDAGTVAGFGLSDDGGFHVVRYTFGGALVDLGKQDGACSAMAWGINKDGDIAGHNDVNTFYRGGVWPVADRYALGDRVWQDVNSDGRQDGGEPGIDAVSVTLFDANGVALGTKTTAGSGQYVFGDLLAGTYRVCVGGAALAGLTQTFDLDGVVTANCAQVTLANGNRSDVDFGYTAPRFALGDRVWLDANGNGQQDGSETGVVNVVLSVVGPNGFSTTVTTGADGAYAVADLLAGQYTVCVVAANFAAGQPLANVNPTFDLDGVGTPNCANAALATANRTDVDFGYTPAPRFTLGDRVWQDVNGNAQPDTGEPGITGATLTLFDANGATLATTTTVADGIYGFGNLLAGTYRVCVTAGLPAGLTQTFDLDGVATSHCATASVGPSRSDVDFGYAPPRFALGDRVWLDANNDGKQDGDETGIVGATVTLTNVTTGTSTTTTTGVNGSYGFAELLAGPYTVCVSAGLPAGATPSFDLDGVSTPGCANATITTASRADVDFGYAPPARFTLGDRVWHDANRDGRQDTGEAGLTGVTLTLADANGAPLATTTTAANGAYAFANLLAGTYKVCVTAGLAAGLTQTYDLDGVATPNCATVTVGPSRDTVDFGYAPPARYDIGDRVWHDADRDDVQDAGESGIGGVWVKLLHPTQNTVLAYQQTTSAGAYLFRDLLPGTYRVCTVGVPTGLVATATYDRVQIPEHGLGWCRTVTLTNADVLTADFGFAPPARYDIGDRVWYDADRDDVQDAGEPGIGGVWVKLLHPTQNTVLAYQQTTSAGGYLFRDVPPGTYRVCAVGVPAGFVATATYDRVQLPEHGLAWCRTVTITTADVLTADFGFAPPVPTGQIGNYTWIDANGNGRQDAGEPALAHVTLTLGGAASGTRTSSGAGAYLFTGLPAGRFTVTATAPAGWVPTLANAVGTTDANDSDQSPATTTLATASSQDLTLDFGFVPRAGSGQGCTPGYWKQSQHFDSWKWYAPHQRLADVFGLTNLPARYASMTLLQALDLSNRDGGQIFRHGAAALLNAVYQSGVSYPYTAPQVIASVRMAWLSGDDDKVDAVHELLATANERGCPLN